MLTLIRRQLRLVFGITVVVILAPLVLDLVIAALILSPDLRMLFDDSLLHTEDYDG